MYKHNTIVQPKHMRPHTTLYKTAPVLHTTHPMAPFKTILRPSASSHTTAPRGVSAEEENAAAPVCCEFSYRGKPIYAVNVTYTGRVRNFFPYPTGCFQPTHHSGPKIMLGVSRPVLGPFTACTPTKFRISDNFKSFSPERQSIALEGLPASWVFHKQIARCCSFCYQGLP